ncbi:hypothetical protein AVEN_63149-1 [Araneus ventricosus]|uniref:Uncharacterized protein n=1 Tax=Araneus ventricosus TaxID=182803 RepID=A0A4Y2B0Z6_ARAVE|nr:hypothetical protein AVEN_63149-1 [Araneus ventricosus]
MPRIYWLSYIYVPFCSNTRAILGRTTVILNCGRMTRTTPETALASPNFRATPAGRHLASTDFTCTRPAYTAVFRWNRVSNLESSDLEAETLPQGHRCLRQMFRTLTPEPKNV